MFGFLKSKKKLVTHDGSFHADDVFACASLFILFNKRGERVSLSRTRDKEVVSSGDIIFDVGGIYDPGKDKFDHHQKGFVEKRPSGIEYSSFGLIWKKYGEEICGSKEVADYLDNLIVEQVDAVDNGISLFSPNTSHVSNYDISAVIGSFLPGLYEDEDQKFKEAVFFAQNILQKEINRYSYILEKKKDFKKAYEISKDKRLVIMDQEVPRYLFHYVAEEYPDVLFAVFPNESKWKVFAFRKTSGSFELRKSLPSNWAGLMNEALQKETGIFDAEFCHRNLFLAVAGSKEGAIKMAEIALKS